MESCLNPLRECTDLQTRRSQGFWAGGEGALCSDYLKEEMRAQETKNALNYSRRRIFSISNRADASFPENS